MQVQKQGPLQVLSADLLSLHQPKFLQVYVSPLPLIIYAERELRYSKMQLCNLYLFKQKSMYKTTEGMQCIQLGRFKSLTVNIDEGSINIPLCRSIIPQTSNCIKQIFHQLSISFQLIQTIQLLALHLLQSQLHPSSQLFIKQVRNHLFPNSYKIVSSEVHIITQRR